MEKKIAEEAAQQELQDIIDFFEVDPETEEWDDNKKKLLFAIEHGRISLNKEKASITLQLVRPIALENGSTVDVLEFHEPTADDLRVLDKYKAEEKMGRSIALASKLSGKQMAIINRMGSRDLGAMASVTALFF